MFAGGGVDSDSVFSSDRGARLQRSKSAAQPTTTSRHHFNPNNPFLDPVEAAARVSLIEEEFGWSGSVGGIRGRDDRQIERDVEYERKMAERTRKRHERKLARQQAVLGASTNNTSKSSSTTNLTGDPMTKRPVFAPTESDLKKVDQSTSEHNQNLNGQQATPSPNHTKLNRGKSLRDKVEAALGRWNSVAPKKSGRSQSVSAIDVGKIHHDEHHHLPHLPHHEPPMIERKEGLGALARRISRKLTIEDQERRRRERLEMAYAEPPLLSHTLVGAASPFPMRPALSTLVPAPQLTYGEAHTDYSLNPFRRRQSTSNHHPHNHPPKSSSTRYQKTHAI
ncbi:hypothetical protein MJO28_002148 [Puccinia striiformis f. sp. tritici]|uniref:Uncharacterized protein n=2 Tax=Puccinia striiformis f. sp. tritici TaxID=168172 RepID=A0A0L0W3E4_9BASI|nr:hypothetical protein Pst134EB_003743 [Puccinia striiformis f. sp. tritici]KAI7961659.1 hypothetical protein MJO28_002148 [Puccinia striiformis f. sp. tritici]KAI7966476.1 hypothetical protein MJO29_002224 [Puccinia striiformis f. sp. tritici]KAI9610066.1 hypothetical protein H4Q26_007061 [Puccinia striiformis f. sp. tritici PST-130]KNF05967.1 hypothetical protein PSTG_00960 [Puccinia striiformis f. sp. tritici PST-78]